MLDSYKKETLIRGFVIAGAMIPLIGVGLFLFCTENDWSLTKVLGILMLILSGLLFICVVVYTVVEYLSIRSAEKGAQTVTSDRDKDGGEEWDYTVEGLVSTVVEGEDFSQRLFVAGKTNNWTYLEGEFKAASEREQHKPLIVKKVVDKVTKLDHFEEAKLDGKQTFYGTVYFVDGVVLGPGVYKSGPYYWMLEYDKPANLVKKGK